jgi:peptidoglycan hydrolase-like protein with peptidoglycan-binding domain/3D (Asp-Asp-Asp) domain-containing protein
LDLKTKMKIKVVGKLLIGMLLAMTMGANFAQAEELELVSYPYDQGFVTSAYYSPLPCQDRYVTGSYQGDIRLNGSGVNSADNTPVYPGMIAAPKTYPFGLKINIPGIGMTAVHDRGGAIVHAGERGHEYDRLDIWMGYGDKGLDRAMNWGKKTVQGAVYGVDENILELVTLGDYVPSEAIPNECDYQDFIRNSVPIAPPTQNVPTLKVMASEFDVELSDTLGFNLSLGSEGERVENLQNELNRLNFYKAEITGIYDELTQHAVYKFQQSRGIIETEEDFGAGVFGPATSSEMNSIITSRNETRVMIAYHTDEYNKSLDVPEELPLDEVEEGEIIIASEMDLGESSDEVRILQEFLQKQGYFNNDFLTDYFGEMTREAVLSFQIDNGIVGGETDLGAGRVGPSTLEMINSLT